MSLSDLRIRRAKPESKPKKISDGGGLFLLIQPTGSKLWRQAYRFSGKQKTLALGAYPQVSLALARERRDEAKRLLAQDIDPAHAARMEKAQAIAANANTFSKIADEFLAKTKREGKADVTLAKKRWLLGLALSDLGERPIAEITATEVLIPLRRVEAQGNYETARRLRSTIGQVFRYAIATARAENDPTFGLKGALTTPSLAEAARLLGIGKQTAQRAFQELERAGFIELKKRGQMYGRVASEWAVTDQPFQGYPPTRKWQSLPLPTSAKTEVGIETSPSRF